MSRFDTTRWSLVLEAGGGSPGAPEALERLCQAYWYPLYAFVRRQGNDAERARDLTQSYFAHLLESGYLGRADPDAGKFRSFLLVSVKHFLANQRKHDAAQKRHADNPAFHVTLDGAEDRYHRETGREASAEILFEKRWASTLMTRALDRLQADYAASDQDRLHRQLRGFLTGDDEGKPYSSVAAELEMSEGAVKVAVLRMRRRLGLLLRDEVAQTVAQAENVDDELRHLLGVLAD